MSGATDSNVPKTPNDGLTKKMVFIHKTTSTHGIVTGFKKDRTIRIEREVGRLSKPKRRHFTGLVIRQILHASTFFGGSTSKTQRGVKNIDAKSASTPGIPR